MNKMKKFASIATAVLMTACMAAPMTMSLNASAKGSITINNSATGHTYEAYQIFKGTLDGGVLSNIEWGSGVNTTGNILNDIKNITLVDGSTPFSDCTDAASVAKVLSNAATAAGNATVDMQITKDFADVVAEYLTASPTYSTTDDTYVINNVEDGYYLVQDEANSLVDNSNSRPYDDTYTRYILQVAGTTTVSPKSTKPSVEKKVYEESISTTDNGYGAGYNDVADYDIGDAVPFKLYGSLPSSAKEYAEYSAYFYQFNDTLGQEFTAPAASDIHVYYEQGTGATAKKKEIVNVLPSPLPDGKTADDYIVLSGSDLVRRVDSTANKITITIENIKEFVTDVNTTDKITVEYSAVLNNTAKVGYEGQVNAVNLDYSNNPNVEWTPTKGTEDKPGKPNSPGGEDSPETPNDKGRTPDDGVIVFTYGFDIDKVIASSTDKLAGAKFAVYYETTTGEGESATTTKHYIKTDTNNKYAGDLSAAPTASTTVGNANGVWVSNATDNIVIKGLDKDKTYYIEELAAPSGYNKLANPVEVTIASTFKNGAIYPNQKWTYSAAGNIQSDIMTALDNITINDGTNDIDVTNVSGGDDIGTITIGNSAGSTLPGTGGIGTTLFYVGGGAMVAVAGVFLITKKRMGKKED